jgi:hypothetical protein
MGGITTSSYIGVENTYVETRDQLGVQSIIFARRQYWQYRHNRWSERRGKYQWSITFCKHCNRQCFYR